ncbi:unnamed protein product, partial [Ceratitis capitata]
MEKSNNKSNALRKHICHIHTVNTTNAEPSPHLADTAEFALVVTSKAAGITQT